MATAVPGAAAAAQAQAVPAALELEWFDLRRKALQKLEEGVCTVDAVDKELRSWDDTVLRFRKLREALTAAHAPASLRCEVYELSAVVCAAARNMAELLKCLQQLVNSIYPAQQTAAAAALQTGVQQQQRETQRTITREVQPQQRQQQQQLLQHEELTHSSELHSSNSSYRTSLIHPHHSSSSKSSSTTAAAVQITRQVEVSAALLLYFVCVPRQAIMQELVKQLKAAARCCLGPDSSSSSCSSSCGGPDQPESLLLLQHRTYQLAVQAAAAYLNCNWVQFMRCCEQQPAMLMRVVMECAVQRMRLHTVHGVVAAYRMLPRSVLVRWLGLQIEQQQQQQQAAETKIAGSGALEDETRRQLVGVMLQAGERGCKGARLAAEQCMISDVALPDTLQFRGSS